MYWEENKPQQEFAVNDQVVDVAFNISCRTLPVDHAYALSQSIQRALPWFADEDGAGLHTIHAADSGNGWMRPEDPQALLYLSQRIKLVLRLPKQRVDAVSTLVGQTLDVAGHGLRIDKMTVRPLWRITTLFSRYVAICSDDDETAFLKAAIEQLGALGIRPTKMLCGMTTNIATPEGALKTRGLMLAELTFDESMLLQQRGLGPQRKLGCGLFLPHKDIGEVRRKSG